ncbi:hypothetical protein VHARVF571_60040 [Vibrio harveyi]|nr:hypothetical protein VHARVF571_60040 [Vibrio harveyi]
MVNDLDSFLLWELDRNKFAPLCAGVDIWSQSLNTTLAYYYLS